MVCFHNIHYVKLDINIEIINVTKINLGNSQFKAEMKALRQTTGVILRFDHTYKFVKCLGAYSSQEEKWVS